MSYTPIAGQLLAANNLDDVASVAASRTSLSLNVEGLLVDFQGLLSNGQIAIAILSSSYTLPPALPAPALAP